MIKRYFIIILIFTFNVNIKSNNNVVFIPEFASLPFHEGFDNQWIDKNGTRDVPSKFWENNPFTGFTSWSREDDGVNRGAWISNKGFNLPSGVNNTLHSARFHSYEAPKGEKGILDLYVDFSTLKEKKYLSFWYINRSGDDSLIVYTFPYSSAPKKALISLGNAITWTQIVVDLGNINTKNIVRFEAKSDRGYSDIQIDEVRISDFISDFDADIKYGNAPLKVSFIDKSLYNPNIWLWDFDNDGIIDDKKQNPEFVYEKPGFYDVKLIAYKNYPAIFDSIIKKNFIQVNYYASLPFYEGFENEWINRDAIRDVPSIYWKNIPSSGNNSWSRNDDGIKRSAWDLEDTTFKPPGANNTKHCAKFNTSYSLPFLKGELSLHIDFSTLPGGKAIKFYYINPNGYDSLFIYLSENSDKTFKEIAKLGIAENWTRYKIDLGDIYSSSGIIKFVAQSDWGFTDIGIDEITIGEIFAKFSCHDTIGIVPFTVYFNNLSYGMPEIIKWDFNNDNIIDSYEQNPVYTFNEEGIFFVKLIIEKGYEKDSTVKKIVVKKPVSLQQNIINQTIKIFPNPSKDKIYISNLNNEDILSIILLDSKGKIIQCYQNSIKQINIDHLKAGIYILKVITTKKSYFYKIFKF